MRENVKFDVALEIVSSKISTAMKNKEQEKVNNLLKDREQIYLGNWEVIEKYLVHVDGEV